MLSEFHCAGWQPEQLAAGTRSKWEQPELVRSYFRKALKPENVPKSVQQINKNRALLLLLALSRGMLPLTGR